MKFELKAIKHSPSLSQETEAFVANVYIDNKKVGEARNDGFGGYTSVHIQKEVEPTDKQVLAMLDILDPNPTEYQLTSENKFELMPVTERSKHSRSIDTVVDLLLRNHIAKKEIKKYQDKVTAIFDQNTDGSCMVYNIKAKELTPEMRKEIEAEKGFKKFLFDAPIEELMKFVRHDPRDPLTTSVEVK